MNGLSYPGEYPQPTPRTTVVQVPVVPDYVTARLRAIPTLSYYGTTVELYQTQVLLENVGASDASVQLQETNDYVSGPRYLLSPAVEVKAKGQKLFDVFPQRNYLELWGTGTNEGQIKAQLTSRIKWGILGFDKTDTTYPEKLWKPDITAWNSL